MDLLVGLVAAQSSNTDFAHQRGRQRRAVNVAPTLSVTQELSLHAITASLRQTARVGRLVPIFQRDSR
jgi:hypothetical protein